jgi:hypothetical protein
LRPQDHWHNGEGRIVCLADDGEVSFVLLGIAETPRTDQYDCRFGGPNGLLQRPNPG